MRYVTKLFQRKRCFRRKYGRTFQSLMVLFITEFFLLQKFLNYLDMYPKWIIANFWLSYFCSALLKGHNFHQLMFLLHGCTQYKCRIDWSSNIPSQWLSGSLKVDVTYTSWMLRNLFPKRFFGLFMHSVFIRSKFVDFFLSLFFWYDFVNNFLNLLFLAQNLIWRGTGSIIAVQGQDCC